ncbi:hypothetical protein ABPG72_013076 [Tetrahymena utriculariae]
MDTEQIPEEIKKFFDERAQLQSFRRQLRLQNIKAKENYSSLKMDQRVLKLQQVTKFLNKLKGSRPMDRDAILNEIDNYNLQNYISEITISIADYNITDNDIQYFVQLCSKLHQSYEDFNIQMVIQIQKQIKTIIPQKEKDEKVVAVKRRDMMRFIAELFVVGVTSQYDKMMECLKDIINHKEARPLLLNVQTALMFSDRFGFEITRRKGIKISFNYNKYDDLVNIFDFDQIVTPEKIQKVIMYFQYYLNILMDHLKNLYDLKIQQDEKLNKLISEEKLTEKDEQEYTRTRNNYLNLYDALSTVADNLELDFKVNFGEEEREKKQQKILEEQRRKKLEEEERLRQESENLFDTEEERAFYEDIFDLKVKLPGSLFSNNYFQGNVQKTSANNENDDDLDQDNDNEKEQEEEEEEEKKEEEDEDKDNDDIPKSYEQFKKNLKHCVSQEKADLLAEQFVYVNNKQNRKKLVKDILEYRKEYNLMVPHLCRFVAVVSKHFKDLGDMVVEKLIKDFDSYREKQRQDFSFRDKKMRYLKYLCELAKFRVLELFKILNIFKSLVDDFNTQQVDLLCVIMDNVGRFIYNNQETRFRYITILDQLNVHLRKANLPTNKSIQLENSISLSKPSKKKAIKSEKQRTELEQYIRFLVLEKLNEMSFREVTATIQKLKWDDQLDDYCFNAIIKRALKGRIDDIQLCAGLLSFLNTFRPTLTLRIVDDLLEKTIYGMEQNEVQEQQKRISVVRFLGELYLYQVVEIDFIFDLLYLCIEFGHEPFRTQEEIERIDSQEDLFRISMICNILEPVRQYITKRRTFPKMLRFLVFFQRYILSKKYVPIDIEFMVLDTFESLDSGSSRLTKIKTFNDANELVNSIEQKEKKGTLKTVEEELKVFLGNLILKSNKLQDNNNNSTQNDQQQNQTNKVPNEEEQKLKALNQQYDDDIERELNSIINHDTQIQSQMLNTKNVNYKKKIINTTAKVNISDDSGQTKTITIIKKKKDTQKNDLTNINNFIYGSDGIISNEQIQFKMPKSKKK